MLRVLVLVRVRVRGAGARVLPGHGLRCLLPRLLPECLDCFTAVIQLLLCSQQLRAKFGQVLLFLQRCLFDINQRLASLLKLAVQVFQLCCQAGTCRAYLLCLSGKLFKVLLCHRHHLLGVLFFRLQCLQVGLQFLQLLLLRP